MQYYCFLLQSSPCYSHDSSIILGSKYRATDKVSQLLFCSSFVIDKIRWEEEKQGKAFGGSNMVSRAQQLSWGPIFSFPELLPTSLEEVQFV